MQPKKHKKREIEEIIGKKKIKNKVYYQLKWKGANNNESTLEPLSKLRPFKDVIKQYEQKTTSKESLGKKRKRSQPQPEQEKISSPHEANKGEIVNVLPPNKDTAHQSFLEIKIVKVTKVYLKNDALLARLVAPNRKKEIGPEIDVLVSDLRVNHSDLLLNYFLAQVLKEDEIAVKKGSISYINLNSERDE